MSGFHALSVRDLVALTVIASRAVGQFNDSTADQVVAHAFEVADAFVAQSEGRWADGARASHASKVHAPKRDTKQR